MSASVIDLGKHRQRLSVDVERVAAVRAEYQRVADVLNQALADETAWNEIAQGTALGVDFQGERLARGRRGRFAPDPHPTASGGARAVAAPVPR
jgi:hypothetical protein